MLETAIVIDRRYQIVAPLGAGGMGTVYRVFDRLTRQMVALKQVTLPSEKMQLTPENAGDLQLALAREFKVLASLRHPHIISVIDYGFDHDRQPFYTMDLLENAQTVVAYARGRTMSERLTLFMQLLEALAYLHRRGIIHHDLKPDNALVCHDRVRVLDFGLALAHEFRDTLQSASGGTAAYMAPELLTGAPATESSDLYAAGLIAYEMLTGQFPFETGSMNRLLMSILTQSPDLRLIEDPSLRAIVARLLAKEPADRFSNVFEVIDQLVEVLGQPARFETPQLRESYIQAATFIGRKREQQQLRAALEAAVDGHGSAWLIGGESGVGKSRLVDEMRIQALVAGALTLTGQGIEGGGVPYQVWRPVIRRLILSTDITELEASILKHVVPDIEDVLERTIPVLRPLTGFSEHQRVMDTIVGLFRHQQRPIVLILEDLHWQGQSLDVLNRLCAIADTLPLLILGTYRDDERPDLPAVLADARVLKLPRLNTDEVTALSDAILGEVGHQPDLVALLQRETEGNVFFLVEVIRTLAEEAGRLQAIGHMTLPEQVFSGNIQALIRRRLARVPEHAHPLLKFAAVAGRQLDLRLLTYALHHHTADSSLALDLDSWLAYCAEAAVLDAQNGEWRFAHDKLREGLLLDVTPEERRYLHRQVAEALEILYPDDVSQSVTLIEHWQQAGDPTRELYYACWSLEYLATVHNTRKLNSLGQRIIAMLFGAPITEHTSPEAIAAEAEAHHAAWQALIRCPEDNPSAIALVLSLVGRGLYHQDDYPAAHNALTAAIMVARQHQAVTVVSLSLYWLSQMAISRGEYEQTGVYLEECLTQAEVCGDQSLMSSALYGLGDLAFRQGDLDKAHRLCTTGLNLLEAQNVPNLEYPLLNRLGTILFSQGDLDGGEVCLQKALDLALSVNNRRMGAGILHNLSLVAEKRGDEEQWQRYFQQALEIFRETGMTQWVAVSLIILAQRAIEKGDLDTAREHICAGLPLALRSRAVPKVLSALQCASWLLLKLGHTELGLRGLGIIRYHTPAGNEIEPPLNFILRDMGLDAESPQVQHYWTRHPTLTLQELAFQFLDELQNAPPPRV